jgi:hypothetical protein
MLFVFNEVYWCPIRFQYPMVFVSFNSNTAGVTCGTGSANPPKLPSLHSVFSGVRVALSLVFCVVFCRSLFVLLSFFFWPLYCLFVFDLRTLITPLVSSNSSCTSFFVLCILGGGRVAQFVFWPFSFGHCFECPSMYDFYYPFGNIY